MPIGAIEIPVAVEARRLTSADRWWIHNDDDDRAFQYELGR